MRGPKQPARGVLGDPTLDGDARLCAGRQLVLRPTPRRLHDLPRITGRWNRMDDDDAGRALARRALVLVAPAAVVETRRAFEQRRVPVGIVVEHDEDLAAYVHVLEVVPTVLGRLDRVAGEHELRVAKLGRRGLHAAARDEVRATCELEGTALALEAPRRRRLGRDAHELD